ncbi:MAG: enoyl-CoA hydratase-related protein, partial [Alcaligenaceae bacterium]
LNAELIGEVNRALDGFEADSGIGCIVITGNDKAFAAGVDIKEMHQKTFVEAYGSDFLAPFDRISNCRKPIIAAVGGYALGGGCELAMACDVRIAAHDCQFGMPEVKVGIPSVIHASLMPRLIGQARAAWLLLSGENIGTEQALQWGLVSEVVPLKDLDQRINTIAKNFAGLGPAVLKQQKTLLRRWEQLSLPDSIADSVQEFGRAFETGEPQKFMNDFLAHKKTIKK